MFVYIYVSIDTYARICTYVYMYIADQFSPLF